MPTKIKVLYLASLVAFMRSFAQVIYTPSQIDIAQDLGISTAMFGLTISVYALTFAISQIFFGPLVDRFESKRILLAGMVLFVLGSLGSIPAASFETLLLTRTLQALGIAAAGLVGIAMISDLIPKTERGRAMGVYEIFNAAGASAGPIVGATLAIWVGWRLDFLFLAIIGMSLFAFASWQLPSLPVKPQKAGLAEMLTILRTPSTLGAVILGLVLFYGLFSVYTLLPILLAGRMGLGLGTIGLMTSLSPFGAMLGSLLGGRIADRYPSRGPLIFGAAGAAAAFGSLTILSYTATANTPLSIIGINVMAGGFAIGLCLPIQLKLMVDFFPSLRGTASGLLIFFRFIGAAIAPVMTGYLADQVSIAAGFGSAVILLSVGVLTTIITISGPAKEPATAHN